MHESGGDPALSGVAETLLIPLYNRAEESQRPGAIIKDEKAVALVTQMSYDIDQVRKIWMAEGNKVARIMLTCEMDRYARDFFSRHSEVVVVHIGCGLDSRFERWTTVGWSGTTCWRGSKLINALRLDHCADLHV